MPDDMNAEDSRKKSILKAHRIRKRNERLADLLVVLVVIIAILIAGVAIWRFFVQVFTLFG